MEVIPEEVIWSQTQVAEMEIWFREGVVPDGVAMKVGPYSFLPYCPPKYAEDVFPRMNSAFLKAHEHSFGTGDTWNKLREALLPNIKEGCYAPKKI